MAKVGKRLTFDDVASAAERFNAFVKSGSADKCWEWQGQRSAKGYGRFKVGTSPMLAHRVAVALSGRDIPRGALVCHACDNPPCCNPDHLFLGTSKDNTDDCRRKSRIHRWNGARMGEKNPFAKITPEIVRSIRAKAGKASQKSIGEEHGVSSSAVSRIINRKYWPHVE